MTLTARLEAAASLCQDANLINVPVPIDLVRQIIEIIKQKEAKQ